jgi:hypothetical protein
MSENEVSMRIDDHLYQRLAAENASDVVICKLCSALVYNKRPSREHHLAWHERLVPGSTSQDS